MYWSELWEFVKRNLLIIVLLAVVAVSWPWTLIVIIPIAIGVLRLQMAMWKVRRAFQNANKGAEEQQNKRRTKAGDVTIVRTEHTEQRVNDDVGEYVDFKEIKEKKTK
jgi:ABC-type bacteriocin/lantibiotic exporter with double-glycine peptidase domain